MRGVGKTGDASGQRALVARMAESIAATAGEGAPERKRDVGLMKARGARCASHRSHRDGRTAAEANGQCQSRKVEPRGSRWMSARERQRRLLGPRDVRRQRRAIERRGLRWNE
ncbi:hypothetical protein BDV95DRAFT_302609 [Massariosphaeria phaeospora]|uniref:Uncharacterized protein n=1 Tax=Massariosphaeria phaeospora TaxID=100035 RepID=A0A7C8MEG0_9PLEO|nr:hypothetical protein BDV95DRAFT_302609 [Massariosphaeria phaeospora]